MPHCLIEYSQNLASSIAPDDLLDVVFASVSRSPLFDAANVSARLYPHDKFREGTGKQYFIHISIKLYAGRSDQDKLTLTQQVTDAVVSLGVKDILVSCECVDTHKPSMVRTLL